MKKNTTLLIVFLSITIVTKLSAQEVSCSNFCVTDIRMDTQPNVMIVSIFFSADQNVFINYPHVSLVTNEEGDTLATGTLNFFGQTGNTEYEYQLNTILDSIPADFSAQLEFKYDTSICVLNYPCIDDPTNEWFPLGAEWYFTQVSFSPPYESYVHLEVTDTIQINGVTAKVISGGCMCSQQESYVYQEGEQIYAYLPEQETFGLLYDFSLIAGDILTVYSGTPNVTTFLIDSVTTYQAGPLTLKVQHIQRIEGNLSLGIRIYERIGSNGCLFPVISFCDPGTYGLRCYEDDITGLLKFSLPERPCNYTLTAIDGPPKTSVNVYPNPAYDILQIESDLLMNTVELIHIATGITVLQKELFDKATNLDIQSIKPGAYLLNIGVENGNLLSRKIIITGRHD